MFGGPSPGNLAVRFTVVAHLWMGDEPAARLDRAQRRLLEAIASSQPTTLNQVAAKVGRGAPAVSRSVDALVRAGLVERNQDPNNRRRLALSLTEAGRDYLTATPKGSDLAQRLERLAQSELRAVERALEILERMPR